MVVARGGARLDTREALVSIGMRGEALPFVSFLTAAWTCAVLLALFSVV